MENFTQSEKELLQKLNKRAMIIVELENVFKAKKVPVNVDALHDIETEELEKMLESWSDGYYLKEIKNNLK